MGTARVIKGAGLALALSANVASAQVPPAPPSPAMVQAPSVEDRLAGTIAQLVKVNAQLSVENERLKAQIAELQRKKAAK